MAMLDGRVALVNGGWEGLKREVALAFAEQGAFVVMGGSDLRRRSTGSKKFVGADTSEEILGGKGNVVAAAGDTGAWEGAQTVVEKVVSRHGKVDILVNVCGPVRSGSFFALSPGRWSTIVQAVLKSAFCCTRAVAPHMQRQGRGRLLHVLPTEALFGFGRQSAANAAFMALVGLSRNAGIELEGFGITSNCVAVHVGSRKRAEGRGNDGEGLRAGAEAPAAEAGRTCGALAAFLASDRAGAISGQIFGVYGREILLFSQSRIARSVHRAEGWDVESLTRVIEPAMAAHFTPLREPAAGIGWAPLS